MYSQRDIKVTSREGNPNYLQVPFSSLPNCSYKKSSRYLFWSDEFDSTALNPTKWALQLPWGLTINNVDTWADTNEISFTGNSIKLGCNKKTNNNVSLDGNIVSRGYSCGIISSKLTFNYGYYEIRCKIPRIAELWPTFWMYGRCNQEIDVFEFNQEFSFIRSKPQMFHDALSGCDPFRSKWYIPQECATANPIMTYHSPIPCDSNLIGQMHTLGRNVQFSTWGVKTTPLNFKVGCVYDNVNVDIDFHSDWHTFGLSFTPEALVWYVDDIPVITEHRFFYKRNIKDDVSNANKDVYVGTTLASYCNSFFNEPVYEQVNFPKGNINMNVIIGNGHKSIEDYNLIKWVDDIKNWSDGYLELDYFRYYKYNCDQDVSVCSDNDLDNFYNVFPNPSFGSITIQTKNDTSLKKINVINNLGEVIYKDSFIAKEHKITLDAVPGIYFIELYLRGYSRYKKVIIE